MKYKILSYSKVTQAHRCKSLDKESYLSVFIDLFVADSFSYYSKLSKNYSGEKFLKLCKKLVGQTIEIESTQPYTLIADNIKIVKDHE